MLRRLAALFLFIFATAAVTTKVTSKAQTAEKRISKIVTQLGQVNLAALSNFQSATGTANLTSLASAIPVTNGSLVDQGSILGDEFTTTIPGGGAFTASAATWLNNFQSAFNDHVSDTESIITRVNALVDTIVAAGVGQP